MLKTYFKFGLLTSICIVQQMCYADWIHDSVKNNEAHTIQLRQHLHQYPELGNMEFKTSELVQKELKSYGIDVRKGFAKTGVIGILKGAQSGPIIALRADMDALPVEEKTGLPFASKAKGMYQGKEVSVMHACGHDAHTAMLLSAAKILATNKDKIKGTIVFVFQPAEESGADIDNFSHGDQVGARKMIADGALNNPKPEVIFGIHVVAGLESGNIYYRPNAILNSADNIKIKLDGKQAHGSMPWHSHDPIVASAQVINNIQTMISRRTDLTQGMGVVSIGSIHGGNAGNIIPENIEMVGTIRSNSEKIRQSILEQLPDMIQNTATANQVKAQVEISPYAPVTMNDQVLTEAMIPSMQAVSGKEKVHLLDNNASGSEDFSYYGKLMPALFVFVGATPKDQDMSKAAANHSPYFIVDDATLKTGVEAHIRFALDYPNVAKQVQSTWEKK